MLSLDEACLESYLDDTRLESCAGYDEIDPFDGCLVLEGEKQEGEACSAHRELSGIDHLVNECEEDLRCLIGVCAASLPPYGSQVGDACDPTVPGACPAGFLSDIYCADDGVCRPHAREGEACSSPYGCFDPELETLLYCRFEGADVGTCAPAVEIGGVCDPRDHAPCMPMIDGMTVRDAWCDPATETCILGPGAAVCEHLADPFAWPD